MNTISGIVLGPLFEYINQGRTTREVWAASYLFSYICKTLVHEISKYQSYEILIPRNTKEIPKTGVGLFPDRLVMVSALDKIDAQNQLDEIIKAVLKNLEELILAEEIPVNNISHLLRIGTLSISNPDANINPILTINPYLDSLEEMPVIVQQTPDKNPLFKLFGTGYSKKNASFLVIDAFGSGGKVFPSLIEIATAELKEKNPETYKKIIDDHFKAVNSYDPIGETLLLYDLKAKFPDVFRHYHKYLAVVYADGDNIGSLLKDLHDKDLISFSKTLSAFAIAASEEIEKFGGSTVYAGGDDLFFFAPLKDKEGNKSLLQFLMELDILFQERLKDFHLADKKGTFSFGVAIRYFKSPLDEGLQAGQNALRYQAKSTDHFPGKNACVINLENHSGSSATLKIPFGFPEINQAYLDLLNTIIIHKEKVSKGFFQRVIQLLPLYKVMFEKEISIKDAVYNFYKAEKQEESSEQIEVVPGKIENLIQTVFEHTDFKSANPGAGKISKETAYNLIEQCLELGLFYQKRDSDGN